MAAIREDSRHFSNCEKSSRLFSLRSIFFNPERRAVRKQIIRKQIFISMKVVYDAKTYTFFFYSRNFKMSIGIFNPPERLVLPHFRPAFLCVAERTVCWLGLDAVTESIRYIVKHGLLVRHPTFAVDILYFFSVCKRLYHWQNLFSFFSVHFYSLFSSVAKS